MTTPRLDQLRVRQLRFLQLLAAEGSLAATAEQLSLSPSAASMMLKEIEGLFGTKLFERRGRGMAPTAQGLALLPRCQTVLGEVGAMGSALKGRARPLLRVGAFPHTASTLLPDIVRRLINGTAAWQVQIVDGSAEQLTQGLLEGQIDLMLGRLPRQIAGTSAAGDLEQRVLYEGRLSVVAASRHPLAGARTLTLQDLADWPWILPGIRSTTRVAVIDAFLRRGLAPPVPCVESPSFFYSLAIVAQTELLTCCATSAARQSAHATSILPLDVELEPAPVAMIWRRASVEARRAVDQLGDALG